MRKPSKSHPQRADRAFVIAALLLIGALSVSHLGAQEQDPSGEGQPRGDTTSISPTDASDRVPPDPDSSRTGAAEDSLPSERPYWRHNLFGRFFRDQRYLFTTWWPSEFRRPGFTIPLAAGTALAATSYADAGEGQDLELERSIQSGARGGAEGPARKLSFIGDAAAGAVMIGSGYLIGRMSHNDRLAEASSLSAEALLTAGLWSSALKAITARERPHAGTNGRFSDYHPSAGETVGSFPSGHATGAFTVATVFAEVYRDHRWVSWVAYGTAGLIGTSRVALGRHYPSDVIVGGVLGHSFGRMVLAHQGEAEDSTSGLLQPFVDPTQRSAGLLWTRRW